MRNRKQPTPAQLARALEQAMGGAAVPENKDKIIVEPWMSYPMVAYCEGHHFGSSPREYKNYTDAFKSKLNDLPDAKKFIILDRALNKINLLHKRDKTLSNIIKELGKIKVMMAKKAKEFDINPGIAALLEYGVDLTAKAAKGELDDCIGREKEIQAAMLSLGRRKKGNPILTGNAGVGKTQIVHGIANRIANNKAGWLNGYSIVELSPTDLVAGTKFVGSLQEKMNKILAAIKQCPKAIIFTDEIHNLMGTGKGINGTQDLANILKPALADGTLKMIGCTTTDEFTIIMQDPAMERRFNNIDIKEPTIGETEVVLFSMVDKYATYHGLDYTNEAVAMMPTLSKRYAKKSRVLPDVAIDLLDLCGATAKMDGCLDVTVKVLIDVVSKMNGIDPEEVLTTELTTRELNKGIGYV